MDERSANGGGRVVSKRRGRGPGTGHDVPVRGGDGKTLMKTARSD